jgi:hypothetical protein
MHGTHAGRQAFYMQPLAARPSPTRVGFESGMEITRSVMGEA